MSIASKIFEFSSNLETGAADTNVKQIAEMLKIAVNRDADFQAINFLLINLYFSMACTVIFSIWIAAMLTFKKAH